MAMRRQLPAARRKLQKLGQPMASQTASCTHQRSLQQPPKKAKPGGLTRAARQERPRRAAPRRAPTPSRPPHQATLQGDRGPPQPTWTSTCLGSTIGARTRRQVHLYGKHDRAVERVPLMYPHPVQRRLHVQQESRQMLTRCEHPTGPETFRQARLTMQRRKSIEFSAGPLQQGQTLCPDRIIQKQEPAASHSCLASRALPMEARVGSSRPLRGQTVRRSHSRLAQDSTPEHLLRQGGAQQAKRGQERCVPRSAAQWNLAGRRIARAAKRPSSCSHRPLPTPFSSLLDPPTVHLPTHLGRHPLQRGPSSPPWHKATPQHGRAPVPCSLRQTSQPERPRLQAHTSSPQGQLGRSCLEVARPPAASQPSPETTTWHGHHPHHSPPHTRAASASAKSCLRQAAKLRASPRSTAVHRLITSQQVISHRR